MTDAELRKLGYTKSEMPHVRACLRIGGQPPLSHRDQAIERAAAVKALGWERQPEALTSPEASW